MQQHTLSRALVIIAACAVVGPVLAAQPQVEPPIENASHDAPSPTAAQAGNLCGLTAEAVTDIVDFYELDPDPTELAAALEVPFNCDAYGGLCDALAPVQAQVYACSVWYDLDAHESFQEVRQRAFQRLQSWITSCEPDPEICEEICSPMAVHECSGVLMHGSCYEIAHCDLNSQIPPFFETIEPIVAP